MVLVTAAAFGPEQLPPSVAWARALGTRLFGGVTGLRVVCILAHLVRRVKRVSRHAGAEAARHRAGTLCRGWSGVGSRTARGSEQRARLGVSNVPAGLPVAHAAAEPQQARSALSRTTLQCGAHAARRVYQRVRGCYCDCRRLARVSVARTAALPKKMQRILVPSPPLGSAPQEPSAVRRHGARARAAAAPVRAAASRPAAAARCSLGASPNVTTPPCCPPCADAWRNADGACTPHGRPCRSCRLFWRRGRADEPGAAA